MSNHNITKAGFSASILLLMVWLLLGTTSSMAWFKEEDTLVNSFYFGDIDIDVLHKEGLQYENVDESTKVFRDDIVLEPGYVLAECLKVRNSGSVPFTFKLSVVPDLADTVQAVSVLGNTIDLTDYLKFGAVICDTEAEVLQRISSRDKARAAAVNELSQYYTNGETLSPGGEVYVALVVYMPESVDDAANYRGDTAPSVSLGISAIANQAD